MLDVKIDQLGIEPILRKLDHRNADRALILWFDRGVRYVRQQLRSRAKPALRSKVRTMNDGYSPPRWARIFVKSPLAHLLEGGTGAQGAPGFNHRRGFFPAVDGTFGVMAATGLPRPQAFLVARDIFLQGGMAPQPFIGPTFAAVEGPLKRLAEEAVEEVLR